MIDLSLSYRFTRMGSLKYYVDIALIGRAPYKPDLDTAGEKRRAAVHALTLSVHRLCSF